MQVMGHDLKLMQYKPIRLLAALGISATLLLSGCEPIEIGNKLQEPENPLDYCRRTTTATTIRLGETAKIKEEDVNGELVNVISFTLTSIENNDARVDIVYSFFSDLKSSRNGSCMILGGYNDKGELIALYTIKPVAGYEDAARFEFGPSYCIECNKTQETKSTTY